MRPGGWDPGVSGAGKPGIRGLSSDQFRLWVCVEEGKTGGGFTLPLGRPGSEAGPAKWWEWCTEQNLVYQVCAARRSRRLTQR